MDYHLDPSSMTSHPNDEEKTKDIQNSCDFSEEINKLFEHCRNKKIDNPSKNSFDRYRAFQSLSSFIVRHFDRNKPQDFTDKDFTLSFLEIMSNRGNLIPHYVRRVILSEAIKMKGPSLVLIPMVGSVYVSLDDKERIVVSILCEGDERRIIGVDDEMEISNPFDSSHNRNLISFTNEYIKGDSSDEKLMHNKYLLTVLSIAYNETLMITEKLRRYPGLFNQPNRSQNFNQWFN